MERLAKMNAEMTSLGKQSELLTHMNSGALEAMMQRPEGMQDLIDKAYANMKQFDDEDSCEGEDDSESDENEELEDDDESGEFDEQEITLISPMKKAPEAGDHANTGMSAEMATGKLNGAANGHVNGATEVDK